MLISSRANANVPSLLRHFYATTVASHPFDILLNLSRLASINSWEMKVLKRKESTI